MRGWGRERVSTQHEFWPTVAGVGARLVQRLLCVSVCEGSSALPRGLHCSKTHLSFAHAEKEEPGAVWTGDGSGFLDFLGDVGWMPGCVSVCT